MPGGKNSNSAAILLRGLRLTQFVEHVELFAFADYRLGGLDQVSPFQRLEGLGQRGL